jgi:hypothetical protein
MDCHVAALLAMTAPSLVMARAEGPWQSIGFHPRDNVSLPFLPERRMAIPYYRAFLLGLVKKAKCDGPERRLGRVPGTPHRRPLSPYNKNPGQGASIFIPVIFI